MIEEKFLSLIILLVIYAIWIWLLNKALWVKDLGRFNIGLFFYNIDKILDKYLVSFYNIDKILDKYLVSHFGRFDFPF